MLDSIKLEPVDALTVQILMDNVTDPLLMDAGPVKRANFFNLTYFLQHRKTKRLPRRNRGRTYTET